MTDRTQVIMARREHSMISSFFAVTLPSDLVSSWGVSNARAVTISCLSPTASYTALQQPAVALKYG